MKARSLSSLQKTYDQSYLICSTAVYYESHNNLTEALRSWRECLSQLPPPPPPSYRSKSEAEAALWTSFRDLRAQCEDRSALISAILESTREAGCSPGPLSPPALPPRPPTAGATLRPSATPPPQPKSPDNNSSNGSGKRTGFLETLRTAPRKGRGPGPFESLRRGQGEAAQAATLAWRESGRPDMQARAATEGAESAEVFPGVRQRPKMGRMKSRSETSIFPLGGEEIPPPPPPHGVPPRRVGSGDGVAELRHSRTLPHDRTRSHPPKTLGYGMDRTYSRSPKTETGRILRKPVHGADQTHSQPPPDARHGNSQSPPLPPKPELLKKIHTNVENGQRTPESTSPISPQDSDTAPTSASPTNQSRVDAAIASVSGNVDPEALQQVAREIVVKGDEVYWDDIAGLDAAKQALKEAVVYPFLRPDLFSGLREPAKGMLLFGPPGTGKTMLARAVATESRSTFFSISASSLTSKYLGESEKLVRALFALAKALAPSIIFVDEIDSLLSARTGGEHEATRRIKTQFLTEWSDLARAAAGRTDPTGDPSRVLVLAATNLPWAIDEAARRRFARRQYIPLPEPQTRRVQISNLLARQLHGLGEDEMERLVSVTEGFSGSDITALTKDAAMGPLRSLGERLLEVEAGSVRGIEVADFERSLIRIRPSVGEEGLKRFDEWAERFGERV